jgi:hypothetical protein
VYEFYTKYSGTDEVLLLKSFNSMEDVKVIDKDKQIFEINGKHWKFLKSQRMMTEFIGHGYTIKILVKEMNI